MFGDHWRPVWEFIKPYGVVLDIGCGPRPPFAPCIVIDPLANEYRKIVPRGWWDGVEVYAQPAEIMQLALLRRANTVVCWNCLDHTIGWRGILSNMAAYGAPDARYAIATDIHDAFEGHPGFDREDFMREVKCRFVVLEERAHFRHDLALLMRAR